MTGSRVALQRLVSRRLVGMSAQEVPHGDVPALVLAPGGAHMEVVCARTLRRLGQQVIVGRLRGGHEQVPEPLERLDISVSRLDRLHRELEVEDGLGWEPWHSGGADVLEADAPRISELVKCGRRDSNPHSLSATST
jgi:hypothetical protein